MAGATPPARSRRLAEERLSRGWSPNGQELLLHTIKDRGFGTWYYNLARIPAGGGTLTTLTGDLLQTKDKTAVGWVPLSP